jgi:hypothetical protein
MCAALRRPDAVTGTASTRRRRRQQRIQNSPGTDGDTMLKLFIGIGIPYLAVIGLLPWVASVDTFVLGVPFIYAWIFAWFVLTSVCLQLCWRLFDRHANDDHPQNI